MLLVLLFYYGNAKRPCQTGKCQLQQIGVIAVTQQASTMVRFVSGGKQETRSNMVKLHEEQKNYVLVHMGPPYYSYPKAATSQSDRQCLYGGEACMSCVKLMIRL